MLTLGILWLWLLLTFDFYAAMQVKTHDYIRWLLIGMKSIPVVLVTAGSI